MPYLTASNGLEAGERALHLLWAAEAAVQPQQSSCPETAWGFRST